MSSTMTPKLASMQLRELQASGERIVQFHVNFAVVDAAGQIAILLNAGSFDSDAQEIMTAAQPVLEQPVEGTGRTADMQVWQFADRHLLLAVPLVAPAPAGTSRSPLGVAVLDLGDASQRPADSAPLPCGEGNDAPTREQYLGEMLRLLAQDFQTTVRTDGQIEVIGTELARVYEELVLLHRIGTNMRVTESDTNFLQLACDSLTDIVLVEGIAVLLERYIEGEKKLVIAAGSGLIDIDERTAAVMHSRLADEVAKGREALLDSEVDAPFKFHWPENIRNIIAVPLCAKEKGESDPSHRGRNNVSIIGLMVAVNRIDKPDFDSTDIKLFTSVASSCAVFVENGRLFRDLKELFVGSLRALTSSIDAKDQYTRGHSERVALVSHWIAERISERQPLEEEQIHKIYLAGLLHDIGKIGIDEQVLRKNGKLTGEERQCIQRHPAIGASILRGIKQMQDIVPGVLCHHERIDGTGYPDGLRGDEIPLTGKIVGLADSFDAMTSRRVYRDALSIEHALEEIRRGLGTQFDETVGTVFLESDVHQLWDLIQDGSTQIYGMADLTEYGATAVGTLLR
ncbi:MAG: HD domain-containing protein [Sedimentisphaerales bacterium]|nr:HD domain-containing protein [Sedimentisphaerales bacterium]